MSKENNIKSTGNGSKISVCIPVYNFSKNLLQTINSILTQNIKECEIVLLSYLNGKLDSPIVKEMSTALSLGISNLSCNGKSDFDVYSEVIKKIKSGFISFLGCGDKLSRNYLFFALRKINEFKNVIIISECAVQFDSQFINYYNSDPFRVKIFEGNERSVYDEFLVNSMNFWGWYNISNKIFPVTLFKKIINESVVKNFLSSYDTFGKDFIISAALFKNADNFQIINNEFYILDWVNDDAEKQNFVQNTSMQEILDMLKETLKTFDSITNDNKNFNSVINRIHETIIRRFWYRTYWAIPAKEQAKQYIEKNLNIENLTEIIASEFIFPETFQTPLYPHYGVWEQMLDDIISDNTNFIIFDCFDTLIQRPLWEPIDLFEILEIVSQKFIENKGLIPFSQIRREAEKNARELKLHFNPSFEDINIDDVYEYINNKYGIDVDICNKIKKLEIELELKYCYARNTGKMLFELAKYHKKSIVLLSDMYLHKHIINEMLVKCGYYDFELYVSSETGASKISGNAYKVLIKKLNIKGNEDRALMIGDNWYCDVEVPKSLGFKTHHLAKSTHVFSNKNSYWITNNLFSNSFSNKINSLIDSAHSFQNDLLLRSVTAFVANRLYDFPFIPHNKETDYNYDFRIIGSFPFALFLLGYVKWLMDDASLNKVKTLHFVSRDGYVLKQAYDIIAKKSKNAPKSSYLYMSRYVVSPLFIENSFNISELYNDYEMRFQHPMKLIQILKPLIPKTKVDSAEDILTQLKISPYNNFIGPDAFFSFIKVLDENFIDKDCIEEFRNTAKNYYSNIIRKGDYLVDVGYRQRIEFALSNLMDFPVPSYSFHLFENLSLKRIKQSNIPSKTFFPFTAVFSSLLVELYLTITDESVRSIDYATGEMKFRPNFKHEYVKEYICDIVQKNSLKIISDLFEVFGDNIFQDFYWDYFMFAMPLEGFMGNINERERELFSLLDYDNPFGEDKESQKFSDYWNWRLGIARGE